MKRLIVGLALALAACTTAAPTGTPVGPTSGPSTVGPPSPTPDSTPAESTSPEPGARPTPACPDGPLPPVVLPRAVLTDVRGDSVLANVTGSSGSVTWQTCRTAASDETPWLVPDDGLDARGIDFLVIGLTNGYELIAWSAFAVPADETPDEAGSNVLDLGHGDAIPGPGPSFHAPPVGDWVVVVTAASISLDRTVVAEGPYYFRVRVTAID